MKDSNDMKPMTASTVGVYVVLVLTSTEYLLLLLTVKGQTKPTTTIQSFDYGMITSIF